MNKLEANFAAADLELELTRQIAMGDKPRQAVDRLTRVLASIIADDVIADRPQYEPRLHRYQILTAIDALLYSRPRTGSGDDIPPLVAETAAHVLAQITSE